MAKAKTVQVEIPDCLKDFSGQMSKDELKEKIRSCAGTELLTVNNWISNSIHFSMFFVSELADVWTTKVYYTQFGYGHGIPAVEEWRILRDLRDFTSAYYCAVLNPQEELLRAIEKRHGKYVADFARHQNKYHDDLFPGIVLLLYPEVEILCKAGYEFAERMLMRYFLRSPTDIKRYHALCRHGSNPNQIFKCSPLLHRCLKDEVDLAVWDSMRKMEKKTTLTKESIAAIQQFCTRSSDVALMYDILRQQYNGKPVFTWNSLLRYLDRIDIYEGIDKVEGLQLIRDYLTMCKQLDIKPKTDSDSLKREHDVCARMVRQRRDEVMERKMTGACEKMKAFDYDEDVFFIRGIRGHQDLLNEATQQRNCVASYASEIAAGKTMIFVMREKNRPDKSLATVELRDGQIRQKFLACNRPIRNKAMSDFLSRWQKYVNSKKEKLSA